MSAMGVPAERKLVGNHGWKEDIPSLIAITASMRSYFFLATFAIAALVPSAVWAQGPLTATRPHPPTPFRKNFYRSVCSFNADGGVGRCKLETDFLQIEDEKDANLLKLDVQLAEKLAKSLKSKIDLETLELVVEARFFPDKDNGWRAVGKGDGEFLLDRSTVALTVAPDGKVSGCEVIERGLRPATEMDRLCSEGIGARFEADPGGHLRTGRQVQAAYFRPLADETDPKPVT